ncbi:MAG: double-strand break repair helicase AddA [Pannonibacter sp.]
MSKPQIPLATRQRQDLASRPGASAWVSANAGSGKTFVLSRRVVRLLLDGTDPSRILCLTFTKAAAAEMATRVFRLLGEWVGLDDAALSAALTDIDGTAPSAARLATARRLFAKALETPGGLKIQTIHAFCEALLHQFPLEANVAGHFSVLDDRLAAELMAEARARVLHAAETAPDSALGQSLSLLITQMGDSTVEELMADAIARRDALARWLVDAGDLELALAELRQSFAIPAGESEAAIADEMRNARLIRDPLAVAEALRYGSANDLKAADKLVAAAATLKPGSPGQGSFEAAWLSVFFTQKLTPTKSLATKKVADRFPDVLEQMQAEQARLMILLDRRRALRAFEVTAAILRLADGVIADYEAGKARRGLLDFEDLVVRTANLLSNSDAAQWVQYKLDQGLDHILVDEAQDTSPRQWQVVTALAEEFFAGVGARHGPRTIFAVGDEKQSIYSFQGAVPAYFDEMRRYFDKRASEAQQPFHPVELQLSFRSTPDVLRAVDKVFEAPEAHAGLSQDLKAPVHEAIRRDPGLIEIWPLEEEQETEEPDDWTLPVDHLGAGSPMLRVARRIAETLRQWMDDGTAGPGNVMVLVRKRGPFVEALNREMKRLGVPAAGSDRLVLTEHIAVMDLVALGRFILLPEDDLSLAAVLKSPLFGLDDDALLTLARETPERLRAGTLWQALLKRADQDTAWETVRRQLETWRSRADFMPPFEFYARLLSVDGGRRAFRARMGAEVDDVLDEFLALAMGYEQTGIPGLEGFLAWLAAAPTEIKRELTNASGLVRIMTVHGSKGLEAPIVILVDPGSAPASATHDPSFLPFSRGNDPLTPPALVWLPPKDERMAWQDDAIADARQGAEEEYRRLLYVAMTRAEDRLIVCGWAPKKGPKDGCWYQLIASALKPEAVERKGPDGQVIAWDWRQPGTAADAAPVARSHATATAAAPAPSPLPDWLLRPVETPKRMPRLQPSRVFEAMEMKEGIEATPGLSVLEARRQPEAWPLERGRLLHRLLETLPDLPAGERAAAAERLIASGLAPRFANRADELTSEVLRIVEDPAFAELFAEGGLAEVPITGQLVAADGITVQVTGQIDRLVVNANRVLILDYKTNRHVPEDATGIPPDYLAQLAVYRALLLEIYPGHDVEAALLWTSVPRLMPVDNTALDTILMRLKSTASLT